MGQACLLFGGAVGSRLYGLCPDVLAWTCGGVEGALQHHISK